MYIDIVLDLSPVLFLISLASLKLVKKKKMARLKPVQRLQSLVLWVTRSVFENIMNLILKEHLWWIQHYYLASTP